MTLRGWLERRWYAPEPAPLPLRPLAALYGAIADRLAAQRKRQAVRLPVPVVIVGNLSVGGTGKTPLVIALIEQARALGYTPGVVSRGHGGRARQWPLAVDAQTDAEACGDEPALIARRSGAPVVVAPDRVAAARALLARHPVDLIIADDGLQHHRLARCAEIVVVDGARGFGNGARLPAGPLREPVSRLAGVDLVVVNGEARAPLPAHGRPQVAMRLVAAELRHLSSGVTRPLAAFAGCRVRAIAGIGHPQRFFETLRAAGLVVVPQSFPDHHRYRAADLAFADGLPLLMTEKDAVKCQRFAPGDAWALPVSAVFDQAGQDAVRTLLTSLRPRAGN